MSRVTDDDHYETLLSRAWELPREERDQYLDRECAGDEPLRNRVTEGLHFLACAEAEELLAPGPSPALATSILGQYELVRPIGSGSSGVVYEARHRSLGRTVAVKVLDHRLIRHREAFARFQRELAVLGRLHHPNVVHAIDANTDGTHCYLVTELLDGATLQDVIRTRVRPKAGLSVGIVCEIGRQVAAGLSVLAECRVVHRDLSPANVMLSTNGTVKLLDFGLVRLAEPGLDPAGWQTTAETPIGNPAYMAPEQHAAGEVDPRADLYSLGGLLYHLLAGHAPFFDRGAIERRELPRLHAAESPTPLDQLRADVPSDLVALIHRLLAKSPDDRPRHEDLLGVLAAHAKPDGMIALAETPTRSKPASSLRGRAGGDLISRKAFRVVGLGAFVLALLGAGSAFWATRPEREPEPAHNRMSPGNLDC